jgi:hypothetical protein
MQYLTGTLVQSETFQALDFYLSFLFSGRLEFPLEKGDIHSVNPCPGSLESR